MTTKNFPDYCLATNKAYEVLAQIKPFRLEPNIMEIISRYQNIAVHSYSELMTRFHLSRTELFDTVSSEYGLTVFNPQLQKYEIFYNDAKSKSVIRFTLAHELGHILLNHTKDDEISKKEANCFARNLLCAIPVIDELEIQTIRDIAYVFEVGEYMASISYNHFNSDRYYIRKELYDQLRAKTVAYMYGYNSVAEFNGMTYYT